MGMFAKKLELHTLLFDRDMNGLSFKITLKYQENLSSNKKRLKSAGIQVFFYLTGG